MIDLIVSTRIVILMLRYVSWLVNNTVSRISSRMAFLEYTEHNEIKKTCDFVLLGLRN